MIRYSLSIVALGVLLSLCRMSIQLSHELVKHSQLFQPVVADWWTSIAWVLSTYLLLRYMVPLLFFPLDVFVPYQQVANYPESSSSRVNASRKEWANEMQRRRQLGLPAFSSPFPNGWFAVCKSRDLKTAQVVPLNVLGKNLVLFRGLDGQAYITDAYCPHLGANMGVLGQVTGGNELQCPFHGWTFRGDTGQCTHIPYCTTDKYPSQAKVQAHNVVERNGDVFLWHDSEGREPSWTVEELPDLDQYYSAGQLTHTVRCHISEIPENGADFAHFSMLHEQSMLAGPDLNTCRGLLGRMMTHKWSPSGWSVGQDEGERHIISFSLALETYLGTKISESRKVSLFDKLNVSVQQIGPAYVTLTAKMPYLLDGIFIQTIVPEEQFLQRVTHTLMVKKTNQMLLAKFYLKSEQNQFERDVAMWNHKTYLTRPVLLKEDGPIRKYRQWYSQFYSPKSDDTKSPDKDW